MNQERAQLLIAALESGEYEQGQFALRNSANGFCCLGVACDLYAEHVPDAPKWVNFRYMGDGVILSREVQEWFGFYDACGKFKDQFAIDGDTSLMELNDNGVDFKTIAGVIREHWEKL